MMLGGATFGRALIESTLLVAVLVPVHIALGARGLSLASAVTILLAFFLPPFWGIFRLEAPRQGTPASGVLRVARFGLELGLLAGAVGAIEKLVAGGLAGEALPVPLFLWLAVAAFFAMTSATAYALIVLSVRAIAAIHRNPDLVDQYVFPERAEGARPLPSGGAARLTALVYSLVPGLGHYYLGSTRRGATFLLVAIELALAALCAIIAGLILVWEARANLEPFLVLAVVLLLSPLALALVAALDVIGLRPQVT